MGKSDHSSSAAEGGRRGGGKRKNKNRMSYLKQVRHGGGGNWGRGRGRGGRGGGGGDYVSAYGRDGHKRRQQLTPGMRGFLLTTNFRESECVRDGYNLLNEYYRPEDEVEGSVEQLQDKPQEGGEPTKTEGGENPDESQVEASGSKNPATPDATGKEEEGNDDEDIDNALEQEIKELKTDRKIQYSMFQSVDTGIKNVVFIKTTLMKPNGIIQRIFDDVVANKETKSRNILRFIPIEGTCRTDKQSIRQLCKEIFTPYFAGGYKSFKIIFNVRYNNLARDEVIATIAEVVTEINPLNVVNLTDPEYTIIAEVIKSTLCLSVLKDFLKFKKYNIVEIVSPTPPQKPKSNKDEEVGKAETEDTSTPDSGKNEAEGQDANKVPPLPENADQEPGNDVDKINIDIATTSEQQKSDEAMEEATN